MAAKDVKFHGDARERIHQERSLVEIAGAYVRNHERQTKRLRSGTSTMLCSEITVWNLIKSIDVVESSAARHRRLKKPVCDHIHACG